MPPIVIPFSNKLQSKVIDIHGYMTLAVYIHYFLPGSLKLRTQLRTVKLGQLARLIEHSDVDVETIFFNTRRREGRWFPPGEMPYPGYCRAPGSAKCLPVLCNCKGLDEKWRIYLQKRDNKTRRN